MTSMILNRRTLLMGLAASTGTAILAACAGPGAATTPTAAGGATGGAGTRPAGTAGAGAANMGSGAGGGAVTAAPGGGPAAGGGAAMNPGGAAGTAGPAGGAAMARPGGMGGTPAGAAMGTVTGGPMAGAPAMTMAGGTGPMPTGPTGTMGPVGPSLCAQGNIVALGATTLQPLMDAAQKVYTGKCNGAQVMVRGGDSSMGVTQVFNGQIALGISDIFAEGVSGIDARQLEDHQICIQPFTIVANPGVNLTNLTQDQAISIFTGKATNYRDVGGPNRSIALINRPITSSARATFSRYVLNGMNEAQGKALPDDSSGAIVDAIKTTPGAIGYLALADLMANKDLKAISINGKAPTAGNITDNSYPLWTYGHLYTKGPAAGLAKGLIDYILSDDAQATLVPQLGYVPFSRVKSRSTP